MRTATIMRASLLVGGVLGAAAGAALLPAACAVDARAPADEPTYRDQVGALLDARCARCHAGDAPAAGYRVDSYAGAIGCTADGTAAVLPPDAAPLVRALARPDHREHVDAAERATLERWVATGAQSARAGVHPRSFADPRSPSGHAATLRATRYRALTDPEDRDACARCHEGAGARPERVTAAAPGATACTTCHAESGGVRACVTCHGGPGRLLGPRDPCFFPADPRNDAHAAHVTPGRSSSSGLDCAACHPRPALGELVGAHGDGHVEVWFDTAVAGREAALDPATRRCTGTCHDRGGSQPAPTWSSGGAAVDCQSCHPSPPTAHYGGPCTSCHREANATGSALVAPRLHVNGRVDRGDGTGTCGACHGSGPSPWPSTGAHAAHASPAAAAPVACETCHAVPGPNERHPLRAGTASVRLAGLATRGGRPATYDEATKSCAATYCHDGVGAAVKAPRWTDGASARACGSCHATPPPAPHAQSTTCETAGCHAAVTSGPGRAAHVNGVIDRGLP